MGILRRIADRLDPPKISADSAPISPEQRSRLSTWDLLAIDSGRSTANPRIVENLSTVAACVAAISSTIASLPAYCYRRLGSTGRELDENHAVARLIRDGPNQHQSWADWIEFLVASCLLRGNGLSTMVADNMGSVRELRPVPWENISPQLLMNNRMVYDVTSINSLWGGNGTTRRYLQSEVMHVRDRSDDGLVGKSRLTRAAAAFSAGLSIQQFANSLYANGTNPSGVLEAEGKMNHQAIEELRESWRQTYSGPSNTAKTLILDQGLKWKSMSVSPEDAELLASRRFTTEELARIFQVPPPIVGIWDHSSFTNSETAGRWFATFTLSPWVKKIESEFSRSVFSEADRRTHFLEIDLSGLTRGDPESRWKSHEIAVKNKILTPNEVREVEGWNPRDGGDTVDAPESSVDAA